MDERRIEPRDDDSLAQRVPSEPDREGGAQVAIVPPEPPGEPGSALRLIGNILWLILSGLWMAIAYVIAGLLMFVTIIGIPFGVQAFKLAGFSLWPFGRMIVKEVAASHRLSHRQRSLVHLRWPLACSWALALRAPVRHNDHRHPFAIASLRLAEAALFPFGREVVPHAEARNRSREGGDI